MADDAHPMTPFEKWPTPVKWAWVSGFVDGEGCFSVSRSQRTRKPQSVILSITQVNPQPLLRVQHMMGGRIYGPYRRKGVEQKPYYTFYLYRPEIEQLWPLLGRTKRTQYRTCLRRIELGE